MSVESQGSWDVDETIVVRAPAKINVFLGVGALGDDGFHPLDTVFQAVSLYDDLEAAPADDLTLDITCEPHIDATLLGDEDDNIIVRAAKLLADFHGVPAHARLTLRKAIPIAGGMAGGSADAAATLVALDRLWDLNTSDEDLLRLGAQLGSDVPFALVGGTQRGVGRGEVLTEVDDTRGWWWVVVPRGGNSTPAVYAAFDAQPHTAAPASAADIVAALERGDFAEVCTQIVNDLHAPALSVNPDLAALVAELETVAPRVIVSGSGATCFIPVEDADAGRALLETLQTMGVDDAIVVHGPVAGAHVVTYF